MDTSIGRDRRLTEGARYCEDRSPIELQRAQMVVRIEVELLGAAIQAENNLAIVNDETIISFGLLPAQSPSGSQREDTHSLRGDGVDIAVWSNREAERIKARGFWTKVHLRVPSGL